MNPNQVVPIDDFGNDTLLQLVERIEQSTRFQHYILREAELDDVWRHIETALKSPGGRGRGGAMERRLQDLLEAVMEAHDLIAEGQAGSAAARLRTVMSS
jgi:hypothetical protein